MKLVFCNLSGKFQRRNPDKSFATSCEGTSVK
jgi:hypothetical protein